jgi:hypothetical protein
MGRCLPVVTARDFSASATCYVKLDGRVRPGADTNFQNLAMKLKISILAFVATIGISQPSMADGLLCAEELTWRDAIHAERTSIDINGRLIQAKVENFSNAWLAVIDEGGSKSILLRMNSGSDAISLTFGSNRPKPIEFAEIAMAVEAPMGDGSWPRMKRPCDIKDGSVIEFSEKDMPTNMFLNAMKLSRFHGVLKRQALSFSYVFKVEADGVEPSFSYQGSLRYGHPNKAIDLSTDMEGWHVYRANTFVKTIPAGVPVPLSAVLNEMRPASQ